MTSTLSGTSPTHDSESNAVINSEWQQGSQNSEHKNQPHYQGQPQHQKEIKEESKMVRERRHSRQLEEMRNILPAAKKRGRPRKFKTQEEIEKRKRERDKINQRKHRERKNEREHQEKKQTKMEIQDLKATIYDQNLEIQTLKNLSKFPSISNEMNTVFNRKTIQTQQLIQDEDQDGKQQIKDMLNLEFHKYMTQLLEALQIQTDQTISAIQSFLVRFIKKATAHIQEAYQACQCPVKEIEESSEWEDLEPELEFPDFLKQMMDDKNLSGYGRLLQASKYQSNLKYQINEFNRYSLLINSACYDYKLAAQILKEKATELRSSFSCPANPFKYLSAADFSFIILNKDKLVNNVQGFNSGILDEIKQKRLVRYSESLVTQSVKQEDPPDTLTAKPLSYEKEEEVNSLFEFNQIQDSVFPKLKKCSIN